MLRCGGDVYDIFGVFLEDIVGFIKKKYWKFSFMVYSDKCAYEDVKDVFDVIKKVYSVLLDLM